LITSTGVAVIAVIATPAGISMAIYAGVLALAPALAVIAYDALEHRNQAGLAGQHFLYRRERAHNAPVLDLIFGDSQLNVYAGELEVRPPGAPTTRAGWRILTEAHGVLRREDGSARGRL
jgi:hypothetical protein